MFNRFGSADNNQPESNNYTTSTNETYLANGDILTLLEQQLANFPIIAGYVKSKVMSPSILFLPQTLKQLDVELLNNQDLILESINFLDIVNIYSFTVYGNSNTFIEEIAKIAANNRTLINKDCLAKEALDDFIFSDRNETVDFILNNKCLLSIYIFAVLSLMFFKE